MKHTASLFVKDSELTQAYTKKVEALQKEAIIGKDYNGTIDGKKVKFWLPLEVKRQYRAVLDAEGFLHTTITTNIDEAYNLRMKFWELIKEHSTIDDKSSEDYDDEMFTVDFIEQAITVYLSELLLPLYHRSCTKARELLTSSLSQYINTQPSA